MSIISLPLISFDNNLVRSRHLHLHLHLHLHIHMMLLTFTFLNFFQKIFFDNVGKHIVVNIKSKGKGEGARRKQKREKREALLEYKKMMRGLNVDPWEPWTWAKYLGGSSNDKEGRKRRRKKWKARKKLKEQDREDIEEQVIESMTRTKSEQERSRMEEENTFKPFEKNCI